MLFTSYEFIVFLCALTLLYYLFPKPDRWKVLLAGSYLFYFLCGASYLLFIFLTSLTVWYAARRIGGLLALEKEELRRATAAFKQREEAPADRENKENKALLKEEKQRIKKESEGKRKRVFYAALLLNLGILAVCKYTNFAIVNVNALLHFFGAGRELPLQRLLLPMGISFYTFQSVGYLIDVSREAYAPEKSFPRFALFVSFFPQLAQGPISRYNDLSKTLYEGSDFRGRRFCFGIQRILWGYFKKLVIADRIVVAVNTLTQNGDTYPGAFAMVGALFYALELYCDFTGGIDITIGVAETLGIRVKENFLRPYFSKNIKEYWNRWHISMGSWFTDYVFYPVSVAKPMLRLSKWARKRFGEGAGKRVSVYLSCLAVWLATGIWHGASWNFVVWGLGNCVVILLSQELDPLYRRFHAWADKTRGAGKRPLAETTAWKAVQIIRTVLLMSALRMFDCYRSVPLTFRMLASVFTAGNFRALADGSLLTLGLDIKDYLVVALGAWAVLAVSLWQRTPPKEMPACKESAEEAEWNAEGTHNVRLKLAVLPAAARFFLWYGLLLSVLIFGAYGVGYDANQFIYTQF